MSILLSHSWKIMQFIRLRSRQRPASPAKRGERASPQAGRSRVYPWNSLLHLRVTLRLVLRHCSVLALSKATLGGRVEGLALRHCSVLALSKATLGGRVEGLVLPLAGLAFRPAS